MHITQINITDSFNKKNKLLTNKPIFKAHPDFYKFNSTQSCFFRRGATLLANLKGYNDIETVLYNVFNQNKNKKKKILIIGIGDSQEVLSYLASIKGIIGDKPLNEAVDLYVVDLQSKPDHKKLVDCAFCDLLEYEHFPKFAEKSFVRDSHSRLADLFENKKELSPVEEFIMNYYKTRASEYNHYRVNDEIFDFLEKTYNNPEKAKWDSRIQDAILDFNDNFFDITSGNNTIPYILPINDKVKTISHIKRTLIPNGHFITDPYEYPQDMKDLGVLDNLEKEFLGIYRKIPQKNIA